MLFTLAFWRAAGLRALRTALVTLVPLTPVLTGSGVTGDDVARVTSTVALAVVLSLATSWWALPEHDAAAPSWWAAAGERAVRSFGQVLVAGIGTTVLVTDVAWSSLVLSAIGAGIGSLLLAAIGTLPETTPAKLAIVGEAGPELVTMSAGSTITPTPPADPDQPAAGTPPSDTVGPSA